jgi:hypothetical protein
VGIIIISLEDNMAGNIPGTNGNVLPGVYTNVTSSSTGASIPGGTRIAAIIGEGSFSETLVSSAAGGGKDGLNAAYTTTVGQDGRHFILTNRPVVSNRTNLYRNGLPLVGLEQAVDSSSFSGSYDYRIDITTGEIELQTAHLVDLGGAFFSTSSLNTGVGTINGLTLADLNAPSETWSIKCVSVARDAQNAPIANTARFIAVGSVSGNQLDANGNIVYWVANNQTTTNGILTFAVQETASTAFREGDSFTVKVSSGVLNKNDSLTASYIPVGNINSPVFLNDLSSIAKNYGTPSTSNTLSLGAQLAFANQTPGVMCLQAAPAMPRRTSTVLDTSVNATSTNVDDFIFPLGTGVTPDLNSQIHVFTKNASTKVETQLLPNKFAFYTLGTGSNPTVSQFVFDDTNAPSGNSYSYSVVSKAASVATGFDGYMARSGASTSGLLTSATATFSSALVGKTLKVIDAVNVSNSGSFTIDSVSGGSLYFHATSFSDFVNGTALAFQVINPSTGLAVSGGSATDGYLTANVGTATGTLGSSATVNFSSIQSLTSLKLKISGTTANNGLYDITAYNSGSGTVTIAKTFAVESGLRFEVLDNSLVSNYLVLNHNVVANGNSLRITYVDSKDASFYDAGWVNALEALETQELDIVVPLPTQTISAIFQNALSHCLSMSSTDNRKERVLICGAINGLTPANLTGASQAAVEDIGVLEGIQGETVSDVLAGNTEDLANYSVVDAFGTTFRSIYLYPDQIVVQAGTSNVILDGFYAAAALAGWLSGTSNVATSATNKKLSGFTILRNKQLKPLTIKQLANAGVTVLQPVSGGANVVWFITTTQSGFPQEQEASVIFIRDRIAKSFRSSFGGFIGTSDDSSTQGKMSARAQAVVKSYLSSLITSYRNLTVVQDSVDPRQWNIGVEVVPVFCVNYVFINISVGTA